jgi:hypothetical protein
LDAIQPLNNVNVDIRSLDIKATPPTKVEILKKELSPKLKKLNFAGLHYFIFFGFGWIYIYVTYMKV